MSFSLARRPTRASYVKMEALTARKSFLRGKCEIRKGLSSLTLVTLPQSSVLMEQAPMHV